MEKITLLAWLPRTHNFVARRGNEIGFLAPDGFEPRHGDHLSAALSKGYVKIVPVEIFNTPDNVLHVANGLENRQ